MLKNFHEKLSFLQSHYNHSALCKGREPKQLIVVQVRITFSAEVFLVTPLKRSKVKFKTTSEELQKEVAYGGFIDKIILFHKEINA